MPHKTEQELLDMVAEDMSAAELEQMFSILKRMKSDVKGEKRQIRYAANAAEVEFFLEVAGSEQDSHRKFMDSHLNYFLGAASEVKRLSEKLDVKPREGLNKILDDFVTIGSLKDEQRLYEEGQAREKAAAERAALDEKRMAVERAEALAKEQVPLRAAEAGSQSPRAEHKKPDHTVVTIPSTPTTSVHKEDEVASSRSSTSTVKSRHASVRQSEHSGSPDYTEAPGRGGPEFTAVDIPPSSSSSSVSSSNDLSEIDTGEYLGGERRDTTPLRSTSYVDISEERDGPEFTAVDIPPSSSSSSGFSGL